MQRGALSGAALALIILGAGCSSTGPRAIDLMPAPAVFAGGVIDPLPKVPPVLDYQDFGLLYATDRKATADSTSAPFYSNAAGFVVRLGNAQVRVSGPERGWDEARRVSLSPDRAFGDYRLQIGSVQEDGVLESTYTPLTRAPDIDAFADRSGKRFAERVNRRLARTAVKDIFVYVHGFRVPFEDPLLVAAELWHFLGYRGAFVAYAWPSTPNVLAYMSDLETATTMARKLRQFLAYLRENTDVERIHIVAFSAGSRLVVRALEQLALLHAHEPDEALADKLRIGSVVFVAADTSRETFSAAMMDGLTRVSERTVVYTSSRDTALKWSRFIFARARMGEMWQEPVAPRTATFLREHPSLEFVDVTDAAGSSLGNGHAYFRRSPWVSSDILTLLATDLDPEQRGLEWDEERLVWRFPADYIKRLQTSLIKRYPGLAGQAVRPDD